MISKPIETAPRDGRPVLVFGTCAWESIYSSDHRRPPEWRVAEWRDELTSNEDCEPVGGWASITSNPYCDYILATAWADLPSDPTRGNPPHSTEL